MRNSYRKNPRRKRLFIFLAVFSVTFIVAILFIRLFCVESESPLDFDNMTLDELTDDEIIDLFNCYKALFSQSRNYGSSTGVDIDDIGEADADNNIFSAGEITGIKTISATRIKDGTLSLNIDSKLSSGKMKIVVVMDGEILEYVDVNTVCDLTYTVSGEHLIYVKILCEKAQMEISVIRGVK